ncbi:transcriptional regulator [Bacteroides thetaiotaomicron]|uniref:winged helix-turn-helix domain-containing protein n=1 Tax=Bacteroides thetaiotaomicron TaxID=818 RepID=UPI0039B5304D
MRLELANLFLLALMNLVFFDFNFLKEQLSLTDGNLASHTRALEELGYIECSKGFVGRKPRTVFRATKQGREAFKSHIEALENFLKST